MLTSCPREGSSIHKRYCVSLLTESISYSSLALCSSEEEACFELDPDNPESWLPLSAFAEAHPGLSIKGSKFFPWTAGLQQKIKEQDKQGVGVKTGPELA